MHVGRERDCSGAILLSSQTVEKSPCSILGAQQQQKKLYRWTQNVCTYAKRKRR